MSHLFYFIFDILSAIGIIIVCLMVVMIIDEIRRDIITFIRSKK